MTPKAKSSVNELPNKPSTLKEKASSVPSNNKKKLLNKKRKPPPSRAPPARELPARTIIANVKRVKQHHFKPKKHGFLCIESSILWTDKIVSKQPKFYAAIDGLPSTTNIDSDEPEWKKRKKNDTLVPFLCFFKNKSFYDDLI
eukprot:553361_1